MSLFSTLRANDRAPSPRDRSVEPRRSSPILQVEAEPSLPRHLLVSLAGITADVTSLQQRCGDAPQLHEGLERIHGRLDGLVDSIYRRAAAPRAPRVITPVELVAASNAARPPNRLERSATHPS